MAMFNNSKVSVGGDIATLANVNALRNYLPKGLEDGKSVIVSSNETDTDHLGAIYIWKSGETATDDGYNFVKPINEIGAGRWVLSIGRGAQGIQGPIGGQGPAGSSPGVRTVGWADVSNTGTAPLDAEYFIVIDQTSVDETLITSAKIAASAAGTVRISAVTVSGTTITEATDAITLNLVPGLNELPISLKLKPNQRIAISTSSVVRFLESTNPQGVAFLQGTGSITTGATVSAPSVQHQFQVSFDGRTNVFLVDTNDASQDLGWADIAATGSVAPDGYVVILDQPASKDGTLATFSVGVSENTRVEVAVVSVNAGTLTVHSKQSIDVRAGVNTYTVVMPIARGQLLAIRGNRLLYQDTVNPQNVLSYKGIFELVNGATVAPSSLQHTFSISGNIRANLLVVREVQQERNEVIGWSTINSTGSVVDGYTAIIDRPATISGTVSELRFGAQSSGSIKVAVLSMSPERVITVTDQMTVSVTAGVNTATIGLPILAGQYLGIEGSMVFQNSVNPEVVSSFGGFFSLSSGSTAPAPTTQHEFEMAFTVTNEQTAPVVEIDFGPYHPTTAGAARSAMAQHVASNDVLTLIADSIGHFAHAANGEDHWFTRVTRALNNGISLEEPTMTALRPSSIYTPDFYGVTVTGTATTGTVGPIGETLILGAGASLSFEGSFEQVDVFYTRHLGAGSLTIARAGVPLKTVSAAGTLEHDVFTGPTPTGDNAVATYTVTASGGSVEITGLVRVAPSLSRDRRLRTARCAHGSWSFGSFGPDQYASILKQASYAGGRCVPIIALGINDSFNAGTTAAMASLVPNMINALRAGGVTTIYGILPTRPTAVWDGYYASEGGDYYNAIKLLSNIYEANDVTLIDIGGIDWSPFYSDGLHPSSDGQPVYADAVLKGLVKR